MAYKLGTNETSHAQIRQRIITDLAKRPTQDRVRDYLRNAFPNAPVPRSVENRADKVLEAVARG